MMVGAITTWKGMKMLKSTKITTTGRTDEQVLAVAEFTQKELAAYRRFRWLSEDAIGLDGIQPHSCRTNGWDTARAMGITQANGFTDWEIQQATDRFTVDTASTYELI